MRRFRLLSIVAGSAGAAALSLALAGCAPEGGPGASSGGTGDGRISIVASTNVYGDIASAVGGDAVEVTSLITSPAQDPHSYEASARDKLAVAHADLVIGNGGGYDSFLPALLDGTGKDPAAVISAVGLAGLETTAAPGEAGGQAAFNEHVWYDLATAGKVADEVAAKLAALDKEQAAGFKRNAAAFRGQLAGLEADRDALAGQVSGETVAATDPVPLYLLQALGLKNLTPEDFMEAAEEGADAPPAALQQILDLVASKTVRFLAWNEQTEGPQTRLVRAAAEKAGIPTVGFSETLPEGTHYLDWMRSNLESIAAATGSAK